MSKTVTNAFRTSWVNKGQKFAVQRVDYKRRYWNGAAMAYESSWQSLSMPGAQFKTVGSMSFSLSALFNTEFKTSNCTISLLNSDYRWTPENTGGVFAVDATATLGYYPRGTKMRVYAGYELADGTFELVSMFSGLLTDYTSKPADGIFEAYIDGYEEFLSNADAEEVSDAFTLEDCIPATGDGTNTDFRTTSVGVGYLTVLQQNASTKTEGVDYTVSDLDSPFGALISMTVAPTAGHTMKSSGLKWKHNQLIETLVGLLCDEAGIGSGVRTIENAIIPSASGYKIIDTQGEWEAEFSGVNFTTTLIPGSIEQKWYAIAALDSLVVTGGTSTSDSFPSARASGTWYFRMKADVADCYVTVGAGSSGPQIRIRRSVNSTEINFCAPQRSISVVNTSAYHDYRITYDATTGYAELWVDGVSAGGPLLYSGWALDGVYLSADATGTLTIDEAAYSPEIDTSSTVDTSPMVMHYHHDLASAPSAMGIIAQTATLNGGTIAYRTAGAVDVAGSPGAFDALVATSVGGQMNHTPKQWLDTEITLTPDGYFGPQIEIITLNFQVTSVNLTIANFKGMDCYTAIQKLAALCNYEIGFDSDGDFFFRARLASVESVLTFNQSDILSKVTEIKPGWNEVVNRAQVRHGASYKEYNALSLPEVAPTSEDKYLKRQTSLDIEFMLANDVNLALGLAQSIHDEWYLARRRVSFDCRLIPQIEIGDIIEISFYEDPLLEYNYWGDPLITWAPIFGTPQNVGLRSFRCKIIELTHDFDEGISRILGLEVLI